MRSLVVYLYRPTNVLIVPEMAQTEAGFYIEIDPVVVVPIGDIHALTNVLGNWLERSIRIIPTPARGQFPSAANIPSVKAVRAKSYTDFVRNVLLWHIEELEGGGFQIQKWISPPRESSFVPEEGGLLQIVPGTSAAELSEQFSKIARVANASQD